MERAENFFLTLPEQSCVLDLNDQTSNSSLYYDSLYCSQPLPCSQIKHFLAVFAWLVFEFSGVVVLKENICLKSHFYCACVKNC